MTEEIIIDGVNVVGCEYYKGKCMEYTHYCQIGCKECTDIGIKLCHYKQTERFKAKITRLEQENKELKNRNVELQITLNEFDRFNNYRSALEKIKDIINQPCDNCKYNKDGVTCSIGDCGEGKLKIIENKINEVLNEN
jgi:hypothetical protein